MGARFIDTEIWNEDWFCELGGEYQNFWNYITCQCNNAGTWKANKIDFEVKSRIKINMVAFLEKVNERGCKERIFITETGRWFLTGFITFQWFNKKDSFDLVLSNKLHKHISDLLIKDRIPIEKVRGLREVLETSKDKDKVLLEVKEDNIDSIYEKKFEAVIVPEILSVWKRLNPTYFENKEADYPACLQIAYNIADIKGWRKSWVTGAKESDCLKSWERIAVYILKDRFWSTKTLDTISQAKTWQKIVNDMKVTQTAPVATLIKLK